MQNRALYSQANLRDLRQFTRPNDFLGQRGFQATIISSAVPVWILEANLALQASRNRSPLPVLRWTKL